MNELAARLTQRGSPFELQSAYIQGVSCKVFPKGPQTLNDIYRRAGSLAQREYIVSGTTRMTFGAVLSRADRLARALQKIDGVGPGARIAIVMHNGPEWITAFIAITSIGATVVAIHADSSANDVAAALRSADCQVVVADIDHALSMPQTEFAGKLIVAGADESQLRHGWIDFDVLLLESEDLEIGVPFGVNTAPDSVALIAFTSGSTGAPKGVVLTHRNLVTGLMNMMLGGALAGSRAASARPPVKAAIPTAPAPPCVLMLAPLSHISGYAQLLLMLRVAGKIVMARPWNVSNVLALIDREKIRSLAGATPAMLRELVRADRSEYDLSSLLSFNIHGVAVHDSLLADLTRAFPTAVIGTGYGLTETCGSICVMAGAELLERPASSGRILPSVSVRLTDPAGMEVPLGEIGEITISGAMVMQRYLGVPEQTAAALRDGWFRTGDLGRIDADGYLQVMDRSKDLITFDGRQLSAVAIERAAASFKDVEEAATLGVVSFGEQRELLVAVISSETRSDVGGLCRHIRDRVVELNIDPRIVACAEFPRTASGKIDRAGLKQQILQTIALESA